MAIIKSQSSDTILKDAVVLDLGDVALHARRIKENAQRQAQEMLDRAEREVRQRAETAHDEAFEKGRAAGFEQGLRQGRDAGRKEALEQAAASLQALQERWLAAANDWDQLRSVMQRDAGDAVLDLALKLAARLVHRVIEVDRGVVVEQVAAALAMVLKHSDVLVRVHPEDRPAMEQAMPRLLAAFPRFTHVRLTDDPTVGRGGCVVSHGQGTVDATLDTQLRRVLDLILPEPGAP